MSRRFWGSCREADPLHMHSGTVACLSSCANLQLLLTFPVLEHNLSGFLTASARPKTRPPPSPGARQHLPNSLFTQAQSHAMVLRPQRMRSCLCSAAGRQYGREGGEGPPVMLLLYQDRPGDGPRETLTVLCRLGRFAKLPQENRKI